MRVLFNRIIIICIFLSLFSCSRSDNSMMNRFKSEFYENRTHLDSVVKYFQLNYFNNTKFIKYNYLTVILTEKPYNRGNVMSDSIVQKLLYGTPIYEITLLKNSNCLDVVPFDLVKFKLEEDRQGDFFYEYDFCPTKNSDSESLNFKSIVLDNNWFLTNEK
jgi:hypothetical protein